MSINASEDLQNYLAKHQPKKKKSAGTSSGIIIKDEDLSVRRDERLAARDLMPSRMEDPISKAQKKGDSEDASPQRTESKEDASPPRRKRHDSPDRDLSPPRKGSSVPQDISPPRRKRHDSDDDMSPPRKSMASSSKDVSPPRRRRHDSDNDMSPPRKTTASKRDASPPRRRRHDSDDDMSPPRKASASSTKDSSPPRRRRHDSDDDKSPPRRPKDSSRRDDSSSSRSHRDSSSHRSSRDAPPPMELKSGLITGRELVDEEKRKQKDTAMRFAREDPKNLGKDAQTVYRDARGRVLSINEIIAQQEGKKNAIEEELEWGTGLAQKKAREDRAREIEDLTNKPFARSIADVDLNDHYRSTDRWGDPLAGLAKKDSVKVEEEKKARKSSIMDDIGFEIVIGNPSVTKFTKYAKRRWNGALPLNRFNIVPGNCWDGVDRSNGFEKEFMSRESSKMARDEQAYMMAVEDM
eukprot:TRINITY_DN4334_c0_g1_i1.p1 TRINITY_DN4334_c0_g1~~TRINITY_DN4334_c0_g1_i1.p1  ORF type:complete len:466 (-),score=140.53 TRINITY_DN4334_c0_g1_i1:102-1499(-)